MNASPRINRPHPIDPTTEPERRKLRKGTQSCWECKRRKVRCNFTATTDLTCDGCKRRKTTCTSQEFPDDSVRTASSSQLSDRLAQLETVVERLIKKIDVADKPGNASNEEDLRDKTRCPQTIDGSSTNNAITIVLNDPMANLVDQHVCCSLHCQAGESVTKQSFQLANKDITQEPGSKHASQFDSLTRILIKAWPNPHDLEIMLDLPSETLGIFHGTLCTPFSDVLHQRRPSAEEILRPPPIESHPVLIARKLLVFATYLQSLSPTCMRKLDKSGVDHRAIMARAVETAHSCVTCNDDILESIEGIECLMIESMYQSNAGNLRSAWHLIRRAMLIAQMMGLHRGNRFQSLRFLDVDTRTRVYPEFMWFRLIQMNRYLSLMLGMLQGTPNNSFADCQLLKGCTPTERMQRMDCVAAGYILQRNEAGLYDAATTCMIDQLLQESAMSLPASWWLPVVPDLESKVGEEMETLEKILRTMDQLTHYHLVAQLHLPYLIRSHADPGYNHSKNTAIDASREVLVRFISLRGANSFTSFCRGINFLALIACTTLCIVHADSKRQSQDCTHGGGTVFDLLANQHQLDRSIMNLTLESMQHTALESGDIVASRTAIILSHLLSVEGDASFCGKYVADPSTQDAECGLGCGGKVSDGGQSLQIHIPYFGTVSFERGKTSS